MPVFRVAAVLASSNNQEYAVRLNVPGTEVPVKGIVSLRQAAAGQVKSATGPGFTTIFMDAVSVWLQFGITDDV